MTENSKSYRPPSSELYLDMSRSSNHKINDVASFMQKLRRTKSSLKSEEETGFSLFYRGHGNVNWNSLPSIYRGNSIQKEHILYNEIINLCPHEFSSLNTTFQKLVKMQHYSIPTRLLDVTQNPLVALYFACQPTNSIEDEQDGEIVVYKFQDYEVCYSDDVRVNLLSNLSVFKDNFNLEDNSLFRKSNFDDLKRKTNYQTPFEPNRYNEDVINSVLCVKPKMENPRIVRQDGAFLIFGCDMKKEKPSTLPEEAFYLKNDLRLIVAKDNKKDILTELELIGISSAKLFPEMDKVSDYLKQTYLMSGNL